jgi:hypothetical protein
MKLVLAQPQCKRPVGVYDKIICVCCNRFLHFLPGGGASPSTAARNNEQKKSARKGFRAVEFHLIITF